MACAIVLIPRPRDGEAREVVCQFCTAGAMLPSHTVPLLGTDTIAQVFSLNAGKRMRALEAALGAINMRIVRYKVFGMACGVVLDTRPIVYSMDWGGVRIKHMMPDTLSPPMRELCAVLNQKFDQSLVVGEDCMEMVHSTCWINIAGNDVTANHWERLFGNEQSPHVRYVGFHVHALAAVALRRWVAAQFPLALRSSRGALRVPSRNLGFVAWPAELRREADLLLALNVSTVAPCCYGVEDAWVRTPPPQSPPGQCTVANLDGHPVVHSMTFEKPVDGNAHASLIPKLYCALMNEGAHTEGAGVVAQRMELQPGQFVVIEERAMVGAALTAWPKLPRSAASIQWNGLQLQRAWFEGENAEELLPVERQLLCVHNCMRAYAFMRICASGDVPLPTAVDKAAAAAAAARTAEIEAIMECVKMMDNGVSQQRTV